MTPTAATPLLQELITPAIRRDPSGRDWLPGLLAATPNGLVRLGELAARPGSISIPLSVDGVGGRPGCFDHPAAPPRELLAWLIDHPERLSVPAPGTGDTAETVRLRGFLIGDDPPGSRARAQERAHELLGSGRHRSLPAGSPFGHAWWRLEDAAAPACVLISDRLVLTIQSDEDDPLAPSTPWYPARTRLVRDLEAARRLAGERRYASLLIAGSAAVAEAVASSFADLLQAGTPHLSGAERGELADAFLGVIAYDAARRALAPAP
jgi:hypothetical protein